jgi:hypothetical protein
MARKKKEVAVESTPVVEQPIAEQLFGAPPTEAEWERQVRQRCRSRCANCGGLDGLRVRLVVPEGAGGRQVESNGTLLCRACEMASKSLQDAAEDEQRPVNVWVSRQLHDRIVGHLGSKKGFASKAALLRYLVREYVADETRYENLGQYQDDGSPFANGVRVFFWIENGIYRDFQARLAKRGLDVSEVCRSLLVLYDMEVAPRMETRE